MKKRYVGSNLHDGIYTFFWALSLGAFLFIQGCSPSIIGNKGFEVQNKNGDIKAGVCTGPVVVYGTVSGSNSTKTEAATTVDLTAKVTAGSAQFFSDSTCSTSVQSGISIKKGQSRASLYVKNTKVEQVAVQVVATGSGISSLSGSSTNKLNFISGDASTSAWQSALTTSVIAGQPLAIPTVKVVDAYANIVSTGQSSLALKLYSDSACATAMADGNGFVAGQKGSTATSSSGLAIFSSISPTKAGALYLGISATSLKTFCSEAVTVLATSPTALSVSKLSTSPSAGACSKAITVTSQDTYGNNSVVSSDTIVQLSGAGSGSFYSDSSCTKVVTQVTIASGSSSATYYYKNATAGTQLSFGAQATLGSSSVSATAVSVTVGSSSGGSGGGSGGSSAPSLVLSLSNQVFPSSPVLVGNTLTLDAGNGTTSSDTGMTYSCVYDTVVDGAVSSGTNCTSLPGTSASFNTATGILSWATSSASSGAFEFKITGTNSAGSDSKIFVADVQDPYVTNNLLVDLDARFSTRTGPAYSFPQALWYDLTSNALNSSIPAGLQTTGWAGAGTSGNPYRFTFDGTAGMDVGSGAASLGSLSSIQITGWIQPSSPTSANKVIFTSGGHTSTGGGIALQQDSGGTGKLTLSLRKKVNNYLAVVNGIGSVAGYYGLDEASGASSITDGSASAGVGTPSNVTFGATSGVATTGSTAATFNGTNSYIQLFASDGTSNPSFPIGASARSVCAWAKTNSLAAAGDKTIAAYGNLNSGALFSIGQNAQTLQLYSWGDDVTVKFFWDNTNWKFVCGVYDGTNARLYGAELGASLTKYIGYSPKTWNIPGGYSAASIGSHAIGGGSGNWNGDIDEVIFFSKALSLSEVQTLFYAGGGAYAATCTSGAAMSSSGWTYISALFTGSVLSLYVNGNQECTTNVNSFAAAGLAAPQSDFYVGSTSTNTLGWSGSIADLKIYSSGSGGATTVNTNQSAKNVLAENPAISGYTINSATQFTLTGVNFDAAAVTKVNGIACTSSTVSSTSIVCNVPALPNDGDTITVTHPGGGVVSYSPTCSGTSLTNAPFAKGSGTTGDPYVICTATQWNAISNDSTYVTKNYLLGKDLDMNGVTINMIGDNSNYFTGTFDGANHTVSNVNVALGGTWYAGLFSYTNNATIKNLNVTITGFSSGGGAYTGVIVGIASGTTQIKNVTVSGSGSVSGGRYTGGLVGASLSPGFSIINSYSTVNVSSASQDIGGIIGQLFGTLYNVYSTGTVSGTFYIGGITGSSAMNSVIQFAYSTGNITGTGNYVGGIGGGCPSLISYSYSTGNISGSQYVGGIVGSNGNGSISDSFASGNITASVDYGGGLVGLGDGTYSRVYSKGSVGGPGVNMGGLFGASSSGTCSTDCFWDNQTSGQASSAIGTGKTTAALQTATTFTGNNWDQEAWLITNGAYPTLK